MRTVPPRELPIVIRGVLLAVAGRADELAHAFPNVETIAAEAGTTPNTARRALDELIRLGWLGVLRPATARTSATYLVRSDPVPPAPEAVPARYPRGDGAAPQGRHSSTPGAKLRSSGVSRQHPRGEAPFVRGDGAAPEDHREDPIADHREDPKPQIAQSRGVDRVGGQEQLLLVPPETSPPAPPPPAAARSPKGRKKPPESTEEAQRVFAAYLRGRTYRQVKGPGPVLDAKRIKIVADRLAEGIEPDVLAAAAQGIWLSDWHVEKQQARFDLALRDAEHIERFAALHHEKLAEIEAEKHLRERPKGPTRPGPLAELVSNPPTFSASTQREVDDFIRKYSPAVTHG